MKNKLYIVLLTVFFEQMLLGSESRTIGFAGMPPVINSLSGSEIIIDMEGSATLPDVGPVQKEVFAILKKTTPGHDNLATRSHSLTTTDLAVKDLTASIFILAKELRDENENRLASDKRQAEAARIDRCRAFGFNCLGTALGVCGLAISIYSITNQ